MGETTKEIKETGKTIVKETVHFGGRIVIGACRGVGYLFGRPFPRD